MLLYLLLMFLLFYLLEALIFSEEKHGRVCLGDLGEVEGGETMAEVYCIREKSIF